MTLEPQSGHANMAPHQKEIHHQYMERASLVLDPIVGSPAMFGHIAPRIGACLGLDARFFGLGLDARC